jgi:uncharacterized C2H2 Zn-finger protein
MTKRLEALKVADHSLDFWGLKQPKCPHCGHEYDIQDHEKWCLYEEGEHDIECPRCDHEYRVSVSVTFSYSTDDQDDDEEDGTND